MFNLNANNQFFLSNSPTDMRVGVNPMCGKVRQAGHEPTNGKVYVFVGKTRKVMKLLHWEGGGYVMYYKRLETGRLSPRLFPSCLQVGFRQIRWDELVLFIEGISLGAVENSRQKRKVQAWLCMAVQGCPSRFPRSLFLLLERLPGRRDTKGPAKGLSRSHTDRRLQSL